MCLFAFRYARLDPRLFVLRIPKCTSVLLFVSLFSIVTATTAVAADVFGHVFFAFLYPITDSGYRQQSITESENRSLLS